MKEFLIRFPLDRWNSLYSLASAVSERRRASDHALVLKGSGACENRACGIELVLERYHDAPAYAETAAHRTILGTCTVREHDDRVEINGTIPVPAEVFAELLKNLVEYSGIDGIQVMITLGIEADAFPGTPAVRLSVTRLDYALRSQLAV